MINVKNGDLKEPVEVCLISSLKTAPEVVMSKKNCTKIVPFGYSPEKLPVDPEVEDDDTEEPTGELEMEKKNAIPNEKKLHEEWVEELVEASHMTD